MVWYCRQLVAAFSLFIFLLVLKVNLPLTSCIGYMVLLCCKYIYCTCTCVAFFFFFLLFFTVSQTLSPKPNSRLFMPHELDVLKNVFLCKWQWVYYTSYHQQPKLYTTTTLNVYNFITRKKIQKQQIFQKKKNIFLNALRKFYLFDMFFKIF